MASFFISHSSADNRTAAEVRDGLDAQGFESLFLDFDPERGIRVGEKWERELYSQLRMADAVIFLESPAALESNWCFAELALARSLNKEIFPVGLAGEVRHPLLADRQGIDIPSDGPARFNRLWRDLHRAGFDPADAFAWDPNRPPYPGLAPFEAADAAVFFGREEKIDELLGHLQPTLEHGAGRFVAVIGASGSGKSSLVRAGLIPRLLRMPDKWVVVPPFTPGDLPVSALARALAQALEKVGRDESRGDIADRLKEDPHELAEYARDLSYSAGGVRASVLLVVDQAEELMVLAEEQKRAKFAAALSSALESPTPLWVVATFRSEFLTRALEQRAIAERIDASVVLGPLDENRLTEVIERPAQQAGLEFDRRLVERIVEDAQGGDALPLLAYTLREMYERARKDGRIARKEGRIDSSDYDAIGGVDKALSDTADRVMDKLTRQGKKELVVPTLLKLTALGAASEPTRRRISRGELGEEEIVQAFVDARLLTSDHSEQDAQIATVEVAHEALFRVWPPLSEAIEDSREELAARSVLDEFSGNWEEEGKPDDSTWLRDQRLERPIHVLGLDTSDAAGRVSLTPTQQEFLRVRDALRQREREQEEDRRRKERRGRVLARVTAVTLVVLVVIAVLASLAFVQRNEATQQREIASSRELAASSIEQLSTDPELSILLALEALSHGQTTQAEDALRRAVPLLPKYTSFGEPGRFAVNDAVLSPDGRILATASADGTARLWDAATGDLRHPLDHHKDCPVNEECGVNQVVFSGTGKLVATTSADGTARLWDAATGDLRHPLDDHKDCPVNECGVNQVVFSGNGKIVATTSADGTARLWDVATGDLRHPLDHRKDCPPVVEDCGVTEVVFSGNGKLVATASDDGTARLWDVATGDLRHTLDHKIDSALRSVAFSPNSARVITGSYDGTARLWDAATGNPGRRLQVTKGEVRDANFSPDGKRVVTAADDGMARTWDAASAAEESLLVGHAALVASAVFSSNGELVVTSSEDKTARVWDAKSGAALTVLRGHSAFVREAEFGRGGKLIVTASDDGTARIWEPPQVVRLQNNEAVTDVAFSSNGEFIATASEDDARIWDLAGGEPKVLPHDAEVSAVAFSPDGARLATATDEDARVWDLAGGEPKVLPHDAEVSAVAFSFDGARLATATDEDARVWDLAGGEPKVLPHDAEVSAVAFSPAGTRLATASEDGARIWEATARPRVVFTLSGHTDVVNDIVFSPDSKLLATASDDGTAGVWSATSGEPLVRFTEQAGDVTSVAFSSDNRFVATGGSDQVARVWRPTTGEEFAVFRGAADDINSAVFSPDNRTVATASEDGTARLYRCEVCLSIEALRRLADRRVRRELRPEERAIYLHE